MRGNPKVITSTANDNVKYVRSLYRRRNRYRDQAFLVEGLRILEEALEAGVKPAFLFHVPRLLSQPRAQLLFAQAEELGVCPVAVTDSVMSTVADTVSPSGILAVLPMPTPSVRRPLTWVLVVDRVRDPGNMGTVLRSALAAGVELVITTRGTVDIYNPKVVRAAMGAHFRLDVLVDRSWDTIRDTVEGLTVVLAKPGGGTPYWAVRWQEPTALLVGGEAWGASKAAEDLAGAHVMIPTRENVESLNVAIATSILLFEGVRQRSSSGTRD